MSLPQSISQKHAVFNPINLDDECFKYAIGARLFPNDKMYNIYCQKYKVQIEQSFDWSGIPFPTPESQIIIFEENNDANVNIYALVEENKVFRYRASTNYNASPNHCFDLLRLRDKDKSHFYVYIKDLYRLIGRQKNQRRCKKFICRACMTVCWTQEALDKHQRFCAKYKSAEAVMPSDEKRQNIVEYKWSE